MSDDAVSVEALAERILEGTAPSRLRLAAARGALPLPRTTLARIHVRLLGDDEEEVREAARVSLESLDPGSVAEILADAECRPEVLQHFAPRARKDVGIAESVVFHPATPVPALEQLATSGGVALVELLLTNEERLLAAPSLLNHLMVNPALRAAQRAKILELLDRIGRAAERAAMPDSGAPVAPETAALYAEAAQLLAVDVGELFSQSQIIDGEEFAAAPDEAIRTAYQRIISLNTAQKAILAMRGGREERLILIRDSNKCVSLGVLKNPRIGDTEVETIARMRNVAEEVLRALGTKREWTKHYPVVFGLVTNPRTPAGVSTNLVNRLTTKDLRNVVANREVPELLRRIARRIYDVRSQPQKTLKKK